jgi:uncharacterized protein YdiU (UPF0061 family)
MSLDSSAPVITPSPEWWRFDNSYTRLPGSFFVRLSPEPVPEPHLAVLNRQLCTDLGLDSEALQQEEGIAQLAGNRIPKGADPIALAYSEHSGDSILN